MIKVVICDDEKNIEYFIEKIIQTFLNKDIEIEIFRQHHQPKL